MLSLLPRTVTSLPTPPLTGPPITLRSVSPLLSSLRSGLELTAKDINNFGVDLSPTDKHQGQALAEVWIGRSARNVGDVTQDNLYNTIWQGLNKKCPQRYPGWCYDPNVMHFSTHAVSRTNGAFPIEIRDGKF